MGTGLPVDDEGWCRMEMGDDGFPHGVSTSSVAASVKPGSDWMPVPPMTAMRTGAAEGQDASCGVGKVRAAHHRRKRRRQPFCGMGWLSVASRSRAGDSRAESVQRGAAFN